MLCSSRGRATRSGCTRCSSSRAGEWRAPQCPRTLLEVSLISRGALLCRWAESPNADDPVASTGPRLLEESLREHARAEGSGELLVLPPATFFPTFDPMQLESFRQRCADGAFADGALGRTQRGVCADLRARNFSNGLAAWLGGGGVAAAAAAAGGGNSTRGRGRGGAAAPYTNHLWSHTWLDGAQKVDVYDTLDVGRLHAPSQGG